MASQAQSKASVKHNKKKDSITIRPSKEMGAKIRAAAKEKKISVTGFILQAIQEYIK